jgi:transposase
MNAQEYESELRKAREIIAAYAERIAQLEAETAKLRALLQHKADSKAAKKPQFPDNYSLKQIRKKKKRHRKSTGRRQSEAKRELVEGVVPIFPDGVVHKRCVLQRSQCAWRIIDGRAKYVQYDIYGLPESKELPLPPGLRNSRSEFGIEIILILAHLHYWVGLSIDNARETIRFFTGLVLSKSQADSLLNQLASDWNEQYDAIAQLIALQMIVYIDETGWKIGKKSCYTWAFSTAMHVLFRCGVGRGREEAEAILGPSFAGIGVTDDYSVYTHLFAEHQLCWAHLLRKAIKLALQNAQEPIYAEFLSELCAIYEQAVTFQRDQRLSVSRADKVLELQERIRSLCGLCDIRATDTPCEALATLIRLQHELVDNLDCLFVFVQHPTVEATNNRSEHNVRREAEIRKGGRTSKTSHGATRRGIIMTILASLRTRFSKFTLDVLIDEVARWARQGYSIFEAELRAILNAADTADCQPEPAPSG